MGREIRILDSTGAVRERYEVNEPVAPGYGPPNAGATVHGDVFLVGSGSVLAALDPPDWEPSTESDVGASGYGLGAAGLALVGGAGWLARHWNQS